MEWQPIETAPKDGTEILGCIAWSKKFKTSVCLWRRSRYGGPAGYFARRGTYEQVNLTHWMPLPEPPK